MYINRVVLNYLNLPNKNYSIHEIRSALIVKSLENTIKNNIAVNHNNVFVMDLEGISIFHITKSTKFTIKMMIDHIINNWQENTYTPDCHYYQYDQKPIDIEKID